MENLLKVDDLKTYFKTHIGDVQAVRGISLYVNISLLKVSTHAPSNSTALDNMVLNFLD